MDAGPDELFDFLDVDFSATVVATLLAHQTEQSLTLVAGSLIFGPAELADTSWFEWSEAVNLSPMAWVSEGLASCNSNIAEWQEFIYEQDEWVLIRCSMNADKAKAWLLGALIDGSTEVVVNGRVVVIDTPLRPARELCRVSAHVDSPAGRLVASAARPVRGWVQPLEIRNQTVNRQGMVDLPSLHLEGASHVDLLWHFAGIADLVDGGMVPAGVFVGSMDGDAWIGGIKGINKLSELEVQIHLNPDRISLWELELELEQEAQGNLIYARRSPLEYFVLPAHGVESVTATLPYLGSGVRNRVKLWHRSGILLDWTDMSSLVESFTLEIRNLDAPADPPFSSTTRGRVEEVFVADRMTKLVAVQEAYEVMLAQGAGERIILKGSTGIDILQGRLTSARGQLTICDLYFGADTADWVLVSGVGIPVRVLTGVRGIVLPAIHRTVEVRTVDRAKSPFHDRFYLWSGGGISVGTSPNGLGKKASVLHSLQPSDAAHLLSEFEGWWKAAK